MTSSRRRFQPGISNHPKPRGRPTRFPRFIQESRFLSNLPIAEEAIEPLFLMTSKRGVDEHKFYNLLDNNSLRLISTQSFGLTGGQFSSGNTAKKLGKSHYITAQAFVWRSRDDCITFEPVFEFEAGNYVSVDIDAGNRLWLMAEPTDSSPGFQRIYYSEDDGDSWIESIDLATLGPDRTLFDIIGHPANSNLIVCTGYQGFPDDNGLVFYTEDRGGSWNFYLFPDATPQFSGFEVKQPIFSPVSLRFFYISTDTNDPNSFPLRIYYSDDVTGGESSFTRILLAQAATNNTDWFNPVMSMSAEGRKIIAMAAETHEAGNELTSGHIWISDDDGASWDELDDDEHYPVQPLYEDIVAAYYDDPNDRLIVITTGAFIPVSPGTDDSKIWVSKPPGQNWVDITPEEDLEFSAFMVIWR